MTSFLARTMHSPYMEFAKLRSHARYNLAISGMIGYPLAGLPATIDGLEINGPSTYGYPPLQDALAAKCGVETANIVSTLGTSMANFIAMAALLSPGDEVLLELPAYELLLSAARFFGADVKRFCRLPEEQFALNLREIERVISPRTKLIIVTNLHNPASALTGTETLRFLGELARSVGARVLVDEVYLDAAFENTPATAFHLGSQFIVTNSLTKVYGLSGLRCGWVLAEPDLARRIYRLTDLMYGIPAHPAERLSVIALKHLPAIAQRAAGILAANRPVLNAFLAARTHQLEIVPPAMGTVIFPRLKHGSVGGLCSLLREKYETAVVPGHFFDMPEYFRIGLCCEKEIFVEGLTRLGCALDEMEATD